ncbi:hypothetical protein P4B35_05945 [Pontiellaceae bacterium B12227]|nr:hypothetical protein [Pontiellaceae bacterium B12227]
MMKQTLLTLTTSLLTAMGSLQAAELYVSPTGNDENPGAMSKPYASLPAAVEALRSLRKTGNHEPSTIYLREGRHQLTQTLVLGLEDGREEASAPAPFESYGAGEITKPAYLTIAAYPGETPVVSAGVQLIYWTHLTANRLEAGESLVNNVDKYAANLLKNAPKKWKDSATLGACFPQDFVADYPFPDMLVWLLHDYWLHCEYAGDRERMRDGLFPVLRQAVNTYRNYLKDNPVESDDGKIHVKYSWSPEYKPGRGQDINFTLALMRWSCQMLLDLNTEFELSDPLAGEWQDIVDNLVEFQTDENGLRIGKDIPFSKPHRHYSHLLGFYPLAVITPEDEADAKMLRTTLDHWLNVSIHGKDTSAGGTKVTGYTCTGATSMYAWLGDGETAYQYLDMFIKHPGVAPTTMYAEVGYNPVIESPFSYATSMHDMLLQSWGGKIRVFAGAPEKWADVAFKDLRTQGAFLVSAKKKAGLTQFVTVTSEAGSPCTVQTDIPNPGISINGIPAPKEKFQCLEDGFYRVELKKGETVAFTREPFAKTDFSIQPIPVSAGEQNLFGLSEKTTRLPGHKNYYKKDSK